ncbi:MAG: dTDP-4-dehydrorhamnose reductase [Flavobacteriales bacterium]|nr:dTDP-4-dehydrorhamnose reductase [Flavobacteriales bacterium]
MKVLVTGGNSQFAQALRESNRSGNIDVEYLNREELDITDFEAWNACLKKFNPSVVINAAAYTNVEKAEDEEQLALAVNADGAAFGALACERSGCKYIQLSTDYVFDGKEPIPRTENDLTNPLSSYGRSKLKGEEKIGEVNSDAVIIRVSWLYSPFGKNFYKTMVKLFQKGDEVKVVNDQIASPTNAVELSLRLLQAIENGRVKKMSGLYHYAEKGEVSWFDFARGILDRLPVTCKLTAVDSSVFPTKAERPAYSKLNAERFFEAAGVTEIDWEHSLDECMKIELK